MSLVISMGFGIDIDACYSLPFKVTLDEVDALDGTLTATDSMRGCLVNSDAICATLISSDSLSGTLSEDTLTGTIGCI